MIDLRKAELLEALLELPYSFLMPNTLFEDEWLCLSKEEKRALRERGLEVRELSSDAVERAAEYFNEHRRLKLNDCFALALAEVIDESILLTGDALLRGLSESRGIEVRGVLWAIDEMETHGVVEPVRLYEVLKLFLDDALVFLPEEELRGRITRLAKLL